jgi:hypothetical protein
MFLVTDAYADMENVVQTSASVWLVGWVRDHPLGTFLIVVAIIAAITGFTLWAVHRVKVETRQYVDTGRQSWDRLRQSGRRRWRDARARVRPGARVPPREPDSSPANERRRAG